MKELEDIVRLWQTRGDGPSALCTLVRARGSSYRRPGARMLVTASGERAGALSGGCLEDEVAVTACDVMRTGAPVLVEFDTRRLFGCSGAIDILVEKTPPDLITAIAEHLCARREFSIVTAFDGDVLNRGSHLAGSEKSPADEGFAQEVHPPIRLIIFSAGPDSLPLRALAEILGWHVLEAEQASELPTVVDRWTAAVVKSHNYGRDYAALQTLLPLELRYVGVVGPRKRRDQLLADILDRGITVQADLFAPAGLDFAAETPEEIALSLVAEIQTVFAGGTRKSLRDSKQPIHQAAQASSSSRLMRLQPVCQ